MSKKMKRLFIFCFSVSIIWMSCLLSGCKKEVSPADKQNGPEGLGGQISFYNASEHLSSQLSFGEMGNTHYGRCFVLLDQPADSMLNDNQLLKLDYTGFNPDNRDIAPSTGFNNTLLQPWVIYRRLNPGSHQVFLMDSTRHTLIKRQVDIETGRPATVYFADKMGEFYSWVRKDVPLRDNSKIGLQVAHFGPDAGKVFFTIDNITPPGFPAEMQFGDISSYIPYENPRPDTLRLKFYKVGDKETVIARTFVLTEPGYSYSVVLKGYQNEVNYEDKRSHNPVHIVPNLHLFITKTH